MRGSDQDDGSNTAGPTYLLGWETIPSPGMGWLSIRIARTVEDLRQGGTLMTVLLSPSQASMLGEDLRKLTKQIADEDVPTQQ